MHTQETFGSCSFGINLDLAYRLPGQGWLESANDSKLADQQMDRGEGEEVMIEQTTKIGP